MDRRNFVKKTVVASAVSFLTLSATQAKAPDDQQIIKPKALKKGDTIGLITPGSAVTRQAFEKAVENIESLGFRVKYSDNMSVRKGFLAGTDKQRLEDLHSMFENPDIRLAGALETCRGHSGDTDGRSPDIAKYSADDALIQQVDRRNCLQGSSVQPTVRSSAR